MFFGNSLEIDGFVYGTFWTCLGFCWEHVGTKLEHVQGNLQTFGNEHK